MIAIIDNYDSFTYNLFHYVEEIDEKVDVFRNDEVSIEQLEAYSHIIISPGPGLPQEVLFLEEIFAKYARTKSILGVCLGMQAMVQHYGGELYNLPHVLHGRQGTCLMLKKDPLFKDVKSPFLIGHYHSWGVNAKGMPENVSVLARDSEDRIMVIKHNTDSVYGIQFHPESILCPDGKKIIQNWLEETRSTSKSVFLFDL